MAIENMLPVQRFAASDELLRLIEAVAMPNLGICFDTSHAQLAQEGIGMATRLGSFVVTLHASDNGGRSDDHLVPGTGVIDWEKFFGILSEIRYDPVFMVELMHLSPARVLAWTARNVSRMGRGLFPRAFQDISRDDFSRRADHIGD